MVRRKPALPLAVSVSILPIMVGRDGGIHMSCTEVVGYTKDGAFICAGCFDGVEDEETGTVFAGEEWDYAPTCDVCGEACEDVSILTDDEDDNEDDEDVL